MGLFDNLHESEMGIIVSKEIDDFLKVGGYKEDTPCDGARSYDGLAKWYCGSLYDTEVCVYKDRLFLYKDLNCGGYEGSADIEIPKEAIENVTSFQTFMNETFESHHTLFDSSLTGKNDF